MLRRLASAGALLVPLVCGGSAWAHGEVPAEGFRSTVSGIEPLVPGLLIRVLDGDSISVRNWSGKTVVVDGEDGQPRYRFADDTVYERRGPQWILVRRGTSHVWHDARVLWAGPMPESSGLVSRFRIHGTADGTPFTISGFIGYRAPTAADDVGGVPSWVVVAPAVVLGALLLAALALPLLTRRECEGSDEDVLTEASSDRR
jgi:hypothetical protein